MVDALVSRFFERNDIEGFFRDKNHAVITALIRTNGTELRNTYHLALFAIFHSFFKLFEHAAKVFRFRFA